MQIWKVCKQKSETMDSNVLYLKDDRFSLKGKNTFREFPFINISYIRSKVFLFFFLCITSCYPDYVHISLKEEHILIIKEVVTPTTLKLEEIYRVSA